MFRNRCLIHKNQDLRAYDRVHARVLMHAGVDEQIRESFESAMVFGRRALELLGVNVMAAESVSADIRERDAQRFALEVSSGDERAGMDKLFSNREGTKVEPVPFIDPDRNS